MVVLPGVQLTSVAIAELLDRGIETLFLRQDGQFRGRLQGQFPTNPTIRPLLYPPQNRQLSLSQIILEQSRWVARCLCDRQLDYEPFVIR